MNAPAARDLDVFDCPLDGIGLIEASAGTGKTWNLCGLYLRLLLERELPVGEILVVTFTRAATAELKSRIRARLVETLGRLDGIAAGEDPFVSRLLATLDARGHARPDLRRRLEAALQGFDEAAIFTIHGYCQRALADTPFAAGLPFALELTEDDLDLRLEATRDFWRRHIAADGCPAELGELLIRRGDSPERWADELGRYLARPLARVRWPERGTDDEAGIDPAGDGAALAAAFDAARARWAGDGKAPTGTLLDGLAALNAGTYKREAVATAATGWSAWLAGGDALAPIDLKEGKFDLFSAARIADRTKKGQTAPRHAFFDAAAALLELQARIVERLESARLRLIRRFLEDTAARLRALKRERRQIAFDDILYNVHRALAGGEHPWLAAELHRRWPAALIDEFQDTDPLQFEIFRRIYADGGRRGSLFLVGDPKQAIYSFRNADLHTYLAARDEADERHTLRENQRSSGALIAACNRIFGANPAAFVLDGLAFEAVREGARPRKPFVDRSAGAGEAALTVWWLAGADESPPLRAEAMAGAARATAAEIARLIAEGAAGRIAIGTRALAPGDIAVLVKSHRQGARMRAALAALGVGCVELSQQSVFHSAEAEELERVLRAIAEPARQPLLFAALATVAMGRDAAALESLAGDEAGLLGCIERFAALRERWLARGFGPMLRQWLTQEGVAARLLARDDGERRLTNLLHLAECLFEAAGEHRSPDALLRWLASRRRDAAGGEAAQLRLESDRNLVQIVTVHRAKGLEYGVVFCPFLWDGHPGRGDDGEARVYHAPHEDGEGGSGGEALVVDFRPEAREDAAVKAAIRRERDAEFVRLVYVALTRAVHRCYLVAGCYLKAGKSPSPTESTKSLLNWIVAGAGTMHADWRAGRREPDEIEAAWGRLLDAAAPALEIVNLPDGHAAALALPGPDADALHACAPPARIPAGWRIGSFSALARGAGHDEAARDHDAWAARVPSLPPPALADDDILRFPRGPAAGDCIHALFERLDFTDPATRAPAIDAALAAHPQSGGADAAPLHRRMLARLAADVLAAPLPDGIVLGRVTTARRLVELGFHLPAPQLAAEALDDWLAHAGYAVPRLAFGALAGYLKGYIDLVFEHEGRFYVLDWKSNHLGYAADDYGPARIDAAMAEHGYHLQHLLYGVALHRHLGRNLPDYDYDRHFGGVLYLFVRGLRPGWVAADAPAGVFFHRPEAAVLASLDALIAASPRRTGGRRTLPSAT